MTTVEWENGWPILNGGKPITLSESFGDAPDQNPVLKPFVDDFSGHELDANWYQLRIPYTKNYHLAQSNHGMSSKRRGLVLNPNVFGLDDRDTPSALLRKQKSLNMTFSATLLPTAGPLNTRQSVGISAYLSELQHQDIGVSGCVNSTGLCIYTRLMMNDTKTVSPSLRDTPQRPY